jgi:ariadne-2
MSGEAFDSNMEYSDDDCCYGDYYNIEEDCDAEQLDPSKTDPEYFIYECLTLQEVERLLNELVQALSNTLQVS